MNYVSEGAKTVKVGFRCEGWVFFWPYGSPIGGFHLSVIATPLRVGVGYSLCTNRVSTER